MHSTIATVAIDAFRAAAFLSHIGVEEDLPFLRSFPRNSCEAASAIFGFAAERKYLDSSVQVAYGHNHKRAEWHFWVEIGDYAIDLAAAQFSLTREPLIVRRPNPLERRFPDIERVTTTAAMNRFHAETRLRFLAVAEKLERVLAT